MAEETSQPVSRLTAFKSKLHYGWVIFGLTFANLGIDASRWPKLASYFETTLARPSFKTAMG